MDRLVVWLGRGFAMRGGRWYWCQSPPYFFLAGDPSRLHGLSQSCQQPFEIDNVVNRIRYRFEEKRSDSGARNFPHCVLVADAVSIAAMLNCDPPTLRRDSVQQICLRGKAQRAVSIAAMLNRDAPTLRTAEPAAFRSAFS